ncbi:SDR family oxidoreductase [Erythrobacter sp.]|uniref:SDR family oxidoreductase n=1 Tax=Erythrobacter sp. TaxID=1042 RepID=UPI003C782CA7
MKKTVLVLGASGVVGFSALEQFLKEGCNVITVSRRAPETDAVGGSFRHISVDLRDEQASREVFSQLSEVTHVVYAALFEKAGLIAGWSEQDQMDTNLQMMRNLMEPLCEVAKSLKHVTALQGTKAYGIHLHPMAIPAKENAPRDDHPNFYWLQEDYIRKKSAEYGFDFTILRPQLIIGAPYGVAMNLAPVIGAYAALCHERGEPFGFPGGPPYVWEAVDARLVAKVVSWAGEADAANGQHFNVTNGDVFEWRNLWPCIADVMGVEIGPDAPRSVAKFMEENESSWQSVVKKHALKNVGLKELLGESHYYADFCFAYGADAPPPPAFVSTIKLRQSGFTEVMDTEETFNYWVSDLIDRDLLPRLG